MRHASQCAPHRRQNIGDLKAALLSHARLMLLRWLRSSLCRLVQSYACVVRWGAEDAWLYRPTYRLSINFRSKLDF